jgi:hypothetical protein
MFSVTAEMISTHRKKVERIMSGWRQVIEDGT